MNISDLFKESIDLENNLIILKKNSEYENQQQTNECFSDKWTTVNEQGGVSKSEAFQKDWYLKLYGFQTTEDLKSFLCSKKIILDAGCGLGYKTAWFAEMAPNSLVIGMDFSDSVYCAAQNYKHLDNLYFVKGDIADTNLKENSIDYVNCDQVIHHTENPKKTFEHLTDVLKDSGEFACYVYAKKALPRELVDNHFREFAKTLTKEQLWELSEQLTELGKNLSSLNLEVEIPEVSLLNIKGGKYDLQRFIYWNFLKCFWNEEMGYDNSVAINYDWYSPSNAERYSEEEFKDIIHGKGLKIEYFHKEEACFSGRFYK